MSGPPPTSALVGSWFGVQAPDVGPPQTLSFDVTPVAGSTRFGNIRIDGILEPDTGHFDTLDPYVWGFIFTGGRSGILWVDETLTRMGLTDHEATVAVVEKGTTALPAAGYDNADVRGKRYEGLLVKWVTSVIPGAAGTGFLDVTATGTFGCGLGPEAMNNELGHTLDCHDTTYGDYFSRVTRPGYGASHIEFLLGPSKDFIVGRVAEFGSIYPDAHTFFGMRLQ